MQAIWKHIPEAARSDAVQVVFACGILADQRSVALPGKMIQCWIRRGIETFVAVHLLLYWSCFPSDELEFYHWNLDDTSRAIQGRNMENVPMITRLLRKQKLMTWDSDGKSVFEPVILNWDRPSLASIVFRADWLCLNLIGCHCFARRVILNWDRPALASIVLRARWASVIRLASLADCWHHQPCRFRLHSIVPIEKTAKVIAGIHQPWPMSTSIVPIGFVIQWCMTDVLLHKRHPFISLILTMANHHLLLPLFKFVSNDFVFFSAIQ